MGQEEVKEHLVINNEALFLAAEGNVAFCERYFKKTSSDNKSRKLITSGMCLVVMAVKVRP